MLYYIIMSVLQNNSSVTPLASNGVFTGTLIRITDPKLSTITISINTDADGVVECFYSQDSFNFSNYGDSFPVTAGYFHKEVICKNEFFYLKYTNGTNAQTVFNLFTKMTLNVRDQNASGGGGGGGDVNIVGCEVTLPISGSVTTDISGYSLESTQNSILANVANTMPLFTFEPLGGVQNNALKTRVENFPTSFEVSNIPATQAVSIADPIAISNTSFDVNVTNTSVPISNTVIDSLTVTDGKLNVTQSTELTLPITYYDFNNNHTQMTMKNPSTSDNRWRIDSTNGRNGWQFKNDYSQDGGNCYWYSNYAGNGNQTNILYQDVTSLWAVVTMDKVNNIDDTVILVMYSPPTGSGDCIPTFAHSRWNYILSNGTKLFSSEKVLIYFGNDPNVHTDLRHLQMSLVTTGSNGPRGVTELIYLMSANLESGRTAGNIDILLHNTGFTAGGVNREYGFDNSLERLSINNLSQYSIGVSVNNFPATQAVSVADTVAVSVADTVAVTGSFYQTTQPVSIADSVTVTGSVDISGSVAVTNDALSNMEFYDVDEKGTLYSHLRVHTDLATVNGILLNVVSDSGGNNLLVVNEDGTINTNNVLTGVDITNNALSVSVASKSLKNYSWNETDFIGYDSGLPVGAYTPFFNISDSTIIFMTGVGQATTGGMITPRLVFQICNEYTDTPITFWDTTFSANIFILTQPFTINLGDVAARYGRFIIRGSSVDYINIQLGFK